MDSENDLIKKVPPDPLEAEPIPAPEAPAEEPEAFIPAPEAPAEEPEAFIPEAMQTEIPAPAPEKKSILKKWWFWVIVALVVAGIVIGIVAATGSSGGSGSSGSTYIPQVYVSPYVTMIKDAKNSTYGVTYGKAFDRFFTNPKWEYFQATTGEHVVEFTGGFLYSGSPATATIQFVINLSDGTFTIYHLSINGQAQSRLMLAAMVQKVFESY